MFMIDFSACAYKSLDPAVKDGEFSLVSGQLEFSIKSKLPGALHEKLAFQFQECLPVYLEFVSDPSRFLRVQLHTCLADRQSGSSYAIFIRRDADRFWWIVLKPRGQVFVAQLDIPASEREIKNWTYITELPMGKIPPATEAAPFRPKALSAEAYAAFLQFLTDHKGHYEFLYKNSMDRYKNLIMRQSNAPKRAEINGVPVVLRVDYQTNAYEGLDPAVPGGNFTYSDDPPGFRVAAAAAELNGELTFQFSECIYPYFTFIENPSGFLRLFAYSCLFDRQSGGYALFVPEDKKGMMIWHYLKPDGRVFNSMLTKQESLREAAKWDYVVVPPDADNSKVSAGQPYRPKLSALEPFQAFYKFIEMHKKHYNSLFTSASKKYKNIIALPRERTPVPAAGESLQFYLPEERSSQK
jgi:hypothetical protein